jgi:SAM-dependent methyltransferase
MIKIILKKIYYFIKFNFLYRNNQRYISNKILKKHCLNIKGKVLNIGSGNGSDKTGDNYSNYFKNCKDYTTLEYEEGQSDLVGDIQNMPELKDETYDCVFCIWVLEHVKNTDDAIKEVLRILKKNGSFILAVPLNMAYHGYPRDYWRFSKDAIIELLTKNKFNIEYVDKVGIDKTIDKDPRLNFFGKDVIKGPNGYVCLVKKN